MSLGRLAMVMLVAASVMITGAGAAHYVIAMHNMKFGPAPAHLEVGDTIAWSNTDMFRHTATVSGQFDVDLPPGKEASVTLKKAGLFKVTCRFHPTMTMQLAVAKP